MSDRDNGGSGGSIFRALGGLVSFFALLCIVIALAGYFHPWKVLMRTQEPHSRLRQLGALADSALLSRDIPIGAVLLYGQTVLGTGYNTVRRDGNAGGHAEINAISAALRAIGEERFRTLDRDSLALIITYEPCAMCRGAIVGYNIRNVEILKAKRPPDLIREDLRILRYYLNRHFSGPASLQDSLFLRHPDYQGGSVPE